MAAALEDLTNVTLIGRSSSHFTRVVRIFAAEVGVGYSLEVVRDLSSLNSADYGGNPALKLPVLRAPSGVWFGALNICRELSRLSNRELRLLWPEDLVQPLLANAQELVAHAMSTEVALIMGKAQGEGSSGAHQAKMMTSLTQVMLWLEHNLKEILAALPSNRDLSYLEVTLFCLTTHLEFRKVLPIAPYSELNEFCQRFAERSSIQETAFHYAKSAKISGRR